MPSPTSPNMGLFLPVPGVTTGPQWATELTANQTTVDTHDHTAGKGVLIPFAALSPTSDLSHAGFRIISVGAINFTQLATTGTDTTNNAMVNVLGQPYWRDNVAVIKKIQLAGDAVTIIAGSSILGATTWTAVAAPGSPAGGFGGVWYDSTNKVLSSKDNTGLVSHVVQTKAVVANNFLTGVTDAGLFSAAQPSFSNISGTLGLGAGGTGQTTGGAATDALNQSTFTIAAANPTTNLSTVTGQYGTVTGSGTISTTGLGTVAAGTRRTCTVGAGLQWVLTNAASLLLPGSSTVALSAGDTIEFVSLGSGNWQVVAVNYAAIGIGLNGSGGFIGTSGGVAACYFLNTAIQPQVALNMGVARFQTKQGAAVASANTITLGTDGNVFSITGTTTINSITNTSWQAGAVVFLVFATGAATQVTVAGNIRPRTGASQTTTPVGGASTLYTMQLVFDGTNWIQPA